MNTTRIYLFLTFLACTLLWGMTSCSSDDPIRKTTIPQPHINMADSIALATVYNAIGPWSKDWNWNDYRTWRGVEFELDTTKNEYRIVSLVWIDGNFDGSLPDAIGDFTELRDLGLSGRGLFGNIPESIGKLKELRRLRLGSCRITGSIPVSIGNLTNLKTLQLSFIPLNGTLPESLGNLVNLEEFYLHSTNIHGEIPKTMKNLKKLRQLILYYNKLSGVFPIEVADSLPNCCMIFSHNEITELPFEIWRDTHKGTIPDLQGNMLSGVIPDWVMETDRWKKDSGFVARQKIGYGYTNF